MKCQYFYFSTRTDYMYMYFMTFKVNSWSGSIEIGVTTCDPDNLNFPISATGFRDGTWVMSGSSVLKDGHSMIEEYGCDLDQLSEGDVVGVMRSSTGELHFFVNGIDQGTAATDIPANVYAVIDMYGKCAQVSIIESTDNRVTGECTCNWREQQLLLYIIYIYKYYICLLKGKK